ncbi:AI-2E family transporter [Microbacterium sp. KUDC0406]|uniref:AI-2E family transporter n=1 Tax=Microbacterium sp. KUDC0406 TaxID=2909588 RepID=UPI001F3EE7C0|nr:AI-2E family transporter [Microbacterium sp. KUDC0406]UJP09760.1 AI-2E family transporter [Microbacterium sp. KUDC0406]
MSAPAPAPAGLSPSLRTLIGLAAAVVVLAGMRAAGQLIGPLALGAVLVIICHPLRHPLERAGWPRWAATTAVIVLGFIVLIVMALLLGFAGARFAGMVADYADELVKTVENLGGLLGGLGLDQASLGSVLTPGAIAGYAASLVGSTVNVLTALFFVFAYIVFMSADASRYSRAEKLFGPESVPQLTRFRDYSRNVRRYYVINAAFGAVVAIIDGLALWAVGVPAPIVWAILAFVTNFIPNIGFVIGLIPPAILALVVGGWPLMLAVIAIYIVVNVTLQVFIQPKFVSDAVSLSLTLSFVSVAFWTFIIGPLGAILCIPLTLLVRALVLEGDPQQRWLRWLSGDGTVGRGF